MEGKGKGQKCIFERKREPNQLKYSQKNVFLFER